MYAVIETGGKQYRVQVGDVIRIEKLSGGQPTDSGSAVKFDQVLFCSKPGEGGNSQVWLGKPLLSGASVNSEVIGAGRGEKLVIVKRRRRTQYKRTVGHRQEHVEVVITALDNGAGEKLALSAEQKSKIVDNYFSNLRPRGEAFTKKTLGSRERAKRAAGKGASAVKAAAPKAEKTEKTAKAPAKKAAAKKASK
ncbi:MAG: 50S ribosomal protein L21 [Bdellovibrionales bacterium]|nr:50S ribosomal protein L21 [Bdellovibrionales bacterium]